MLRIFESQFNEYMTVTDNLNREIVVYNLNAELIILNCEFIPYIEITEKTEKCFEGIQKLKALGLIPMKYPF